MVFSVRTFNNINQIGLKELGNKFQIDGDHAANPDAFIIRSENLHGFDFPENLKLLPVLVQGLTIFQSKRQQRKVLLSLTLQVPMPMP